MRQVHAQCPIPWLWRRRNSRSSRNSGERNFRFTTPGTGRPAPGDRLAELRSRRSPDFFIASNLLLQLRLGDGGAEPPPADHRDVCHRGVGRRLYAIDRDPPSSAPAARTAPSRPVPDTLRVCRNGPVVPVTLMLLRATFTAFASVIPRRLVPLILERERPSIGLIGKTRGCVHQRLAIHGDVIERDIDDA